MRSAQKEALDWPLATASVALKMSGSTVSGARRVGSRSSDAVGLRSCGQSLAGKTMSAAAAEAAAKAGSSGATPLSQNGYKVQLAQVAVKRALLAVGSAA